MSYEFADRPSLESALKLWCTDPTSAASTYGDIGTWNVGFVSDFGNLFSTMNLGGNYTYAGEPYYSYTYNDDWVDPNADESCAATFNEDIDDWETSHVTNMMSTFRGASAFNQPLNGWNTASVTSMRGMFAGASAFDQTLNGWNTASVTSMRYMFVQASAFDQPLNGWNTASVISMQAMFYYASAFNQTLDGWNTASVTDMQAMFNYASAFDQTLNGWNTASVLSMGWMFGGASAFNQTLNGWNTASVTSMHGIFAQAPAFNQPLDGWNTASVTNMQEMLYGASAFNQTLNGWNTASVTNMQWMFEDASAFDQPLDGWNTASVTNMRYMFYQASAFDQTLSAWNMSSVTEAQDMFDGASSLSGCNQAAIYNSFSAQIPSIWDDQLSGFTCITPSPPPAPTAPPPAPTAGDDPTFVGADNISYEVRGEPWRYFNLLSAPRLSLNAQFLPVPDKFVVDPITDTVLGTLHLATCSVPPTKGAIFTPSSRRGTLGILFDVSDGSLKCTLTTGVGKVTTPCGPALATAGVTIRREIVGCSLTPEPRCAYVLEERMPLLEAKDASIVRVHIQRTNITLPSGARIMVLRDVIDHTEPAKMATIDCSHFANYASSLRACEVARAAARGEAPMTAWQNLSKLEKLILNAHFNRNDNNNRSKQLHFHNVQLDSLHPYAQNEVHGLLGQRAISPAPMQAPIEFDPLGGDGIAPSELSMLASQSALSAAPTMGGGGGVGAGTTIHAVVQPDGEQRSHWTQGEGAIVGSYRDYQVKWVSSHGPGDFAYSRFVGCAADKNGE